MANEVWDYTNWAKGEPNNLIGIENYLEHFTDGVSAGFWNDLGEGNNGGCGGNGGCLDEWYPMSTICEGDDDVVFNPANGHYYELVAVRGSGVNWHEARAAAAARASNGTTGHLATVTSAQEDNFLISNFSRIRPEYVWLGATDEASEGDCEVIYSTCGFPLWKRYLAFFPGQDLIDEIETMNLELPTKLDLKITGELYDGTSFEGLDIIRVKNIRKKWRKRK